MTSNLYFRVSFSRAMLSKWVVAMAITLIAVLSARSVEAAFQNEPRKWHDHFCIRNEVCLLADVDGDGKDDLVAFVRDTQTDARRGDVWVSLSQGSSFGRSSVWHGWMCIRKEVCVAGDFDGDGRDDVAALVRDQASGHWSNNVWVALSTGSSFRTSTVWNGNLCKAGQVCRVGDANGDGRDDIIIFVRDSSTGKKRGDVLVALSTGTSFGKPQVWHGFFCIGKEVCRVADVNGDNRDDIIAFVRDTKTGADQGDVWVSLSQGSSFGRSSIWHGWMCIRKEVCVAGDFDGDGRDDVAALVRNQASGHWNNNFWVAASTSSSFGVSTLMHGDICRAGEVCRVADVDGNGRDDIVVFTRDNQSGNRRGDVHVLLSVPDPRPDPPPPPPPPPAQEPSILFDTANWLLTGSGFDRNAQVRIRVVVCCSIEGIPDIRQGQMLTVSDTSGRIHVSNLNLRTILPAFDDGYGFIWYGCYPGQEVSITARNHLDSDGLWSNIASFFCW